MSKVKTGMAVVGLAFDLIVFVLVFSGINQSSLTIPEIVLAVLGTVLIFLGTARRKRTPDSEL